MQTSRGANQQLLGLWLPPCKKVCYKDKGKKGGTILWYPQTEQKLALSVSGKEK